MDSLFLVTDEIKQIIVQIKNVAQLLWERGWSEKNAGNISVMLPYSFKPGININTNNIELDTALPQLCNKCFFVTATGTRMRDIAINPANNGVFVQVCPNGKTCIVAKLTNKTLKPTSELPAHLGIHNLIALRGTNQTVVMHTHATEVVALTQHPEIKSADAINKIIWGMHPETMIFIPNGVGFIPYMLPGSQAIADATVKSFACYDIVVWEKHGIFAIGKSVDDTFDNIDIVCKSAKIWFTCRGANFTPEGLTNEQLDELRLLTKKFNS